MIKLLLALIIPTFLAGDLHPLHISVTEVNHDEKDKSLEIMSRIFIDDLETTMRKRLNSPDLDILNPKDKTVDAMMRDYFNEKLIVSLDNRKHPLNYLGHERDGDVFIFYIEVPKVKKWKTIVVTNSVLTEIFEDQSNLVHVTRGEVVKSLRLNKDNPAGTLSFQE
jgi:hypothetical protein